MIGDDWQIGFSIGQEVLLKHLAKALSHWHNSYEHFSVMPPNGTTPKYIIHLLINVIIRTFFKMFSSWVGGLSIMTPLKMKRLAHESLAFQLWQTQHKTNWIID